MRTVDIYVDGKLVHQVVVLRGETAAQAISRVKATIQVVATDKLS